MLFPTKLNAFPGLLLAAIPPAAAVGFALAFLSLIGGTTEAWRMADAAGPYSLLMAVAVLGVTLMLSALLSMGPSGRHAPLVVLVGLAMLPWFLGIAGTEEAMEKVLAALPDVASGDALVVLVAGTGGAMVTRLLGAWMSAALLVGVAVGLVLLHKRAVLAGQDDGRLLGAALSLVLGCIALLVALEAHQLFEMLTTLAIQTPETRPGLIVTGTGTLTHLQKLRSVALGALTLLSLALIGRQFYPRRRAMTEWAGSLLLATLAAGVLILDARPMQLAAKGAREAEATHALLPMLVSTNPSNVHVSVHRIHIQAPGVWLVR